MPDKSFEQSHLRYEIENFVILNLFQDLYIINKSLSFTTLSFAEILKQVQDDVPFGTYLKWDC